MEHVIRYFLDNPEAGRRRIAEIVKGEGAGLRAFVNDAAADPEAAPFFKDNFAAIAAAKDGVCEIGGREVFIETTGRPAELVICGGGHVSNAVTRIAKMTGFHVTVFEDRPLFADHARAAGADVVLCDSFENNLKKTAGGDNIYYIILTRGHRFDLTCLRDLLYKPYAYIGMISSRGRAATAKNTLRAEGYPDEKLDAIHAPIGLKIGAETPEEIGVSIMAELIECRSRVRAGSGFPRNILKEFGDPGDKVLVTIIERHGSAPRAAGTKMLIKADGSVAGTVGGGCVEAELIGIGRQMLSDPEAVTRIEDVDMSVNNAEDEGMVCGGTIRVLLEKITETGSAEKPVMSNYHDDLL